MPAKRSNPKTMHRAGELRKEPTPAERRLWSVLRGNKISGVSFRRHTCPGGGARDMQLETIFLILYQSNKN